MNESSKNIIYQKKMKKILVTGGTGFIGSHTCISLLERDYKIVVIDSFVNSKNISLERIRSILEIKGLKKNNLFFENGDIRDQYFLEKIFSKAIKDNEPIEGVIHFAGLKSVSESLNNPFLYWENNVFGSFSLFKVMEKFNCRTIVFSSSATVYGEISDKQISENFNINPNNPYGQTKAAVEYLLEGIFKSAQKKWKVANLRYFNPIGAHDTGLLGEDPSKPPNNLFPRICRVAEGTYKVLKIYGNDWDTNDGTCIRDYIHVMDLADAHVSAFEYLLNNKPQLTCLNIGTGKGTSILELIKIFNNINNCNLSYVFTKRRPGDIPVVIANNQKAIEDLKWEPKRNLEQMCKDGWEWQKNYVQSDI